MKYLLLVHHNEDMVTRRHSSLKRQEPSFECERAKQSSQTARSWRPTNSSPATSWSMPRISNRPLRLLNEYLARASARSRLDLCTKSVGYRGNSLQQYGCRFGGCRFDY